jgi:excisionase family DNA binding protein
MTRAKPPKHEARRRAQRGAQPLPPHGAPATVALAVAAGYLGIHTSTLRRWIASGRLKGAGQGVEIAELVRIRELMEAERR